MAERRHAHIKCDLDLSQAGRDAVRPAGCSAAECSHLLRTLSEAAFGRRRQEIVCLAGEDETDAPSVSWGFLPLRGTIGKDRVLQLLPTPCQGQSPAFSHSQVFER